MRHAKWQFRSNGSAWHGVMRLAPVVTKRKLVEISSDQRGVIMAKSKSFPKTDVGASTPRPMSSEQHDHLKSLVDHTLTSAEYNAHGHAVGKGATGKMVPSHSHLQDWIVSSAGCIAESPEHEQRRRGISGSE
jgi:hypothetical protein